MKSTFLLPCVGILLCLQAFRCHKSSNNNNNNNNSNNNNNVFSCDIGCGDETAHVPARSKCRARGSFRFSFNSNIQPRKFRYSRESTPASSWHRSEILMTYHRVRRARVRFQRYWNSAWDWPRRRHVVRPPVAWTWWWSRSIASCIISPRNRAPGRTTSAWTWPGATTVSLASKTHVWSDGPAKKWKMKNKKN